MWIENPVVIGSAAAIRDQAIERAAFGAGAVLASALWFAMLGFGARHAARGLQRPAVLRTLGLLGAVRLCGTAVALLQAATAGLRGAGLPA